MYLDTAASINEAIEHGRQAIRLARAVRVSAEYLQETLPDGSIAYRGEHYVEDTLAGTVDSVVAVDTAYLRRMVMVLVSTEHVPVIRGRRTGFSAAAPDWISASPASRARTTAIGVASAHFDEIQAWTEAERQARRSLAFATVTRMKSAIESRTGGTSNGAIIASTATEMRDVSVVERWRDESRLYVLIRARSVSAGPE